VLNRWQLDLLLSGWAIFYKARTLKKEWSEHILRTREFLVNCLAGGTELHVLGAGRLFDFPLKELATKYDKIHLYDADPGAFRYLRSLEKSNNCLKAHLIELTGGLKDFSSTLDKIQKIDGIFSRQEFLKIKLPCLPIDPKSDNQIISLNLLSQLPLSFRQIFERWITKRYGNVFLIKNEHLWLEEYNKFGGQVVSSHLELLAKSNATKLIVIADTEQLFYPKVIPKLPFPKAEPFSWEINSKVEQPLEVTSSVCGLDIPTDLAVLFPNYKLGQKQFWPWHLTPARGNKDGIICRVDALELLHKRLT